MAPPTLEYTLWLVPLVAIALALLLARLFRTRLTLYLKKRQIRQAVHRLGPKVYPNLLVPDGLDGVAAADYVVLTHKGILLIAVNWFDGNIFGGPNTDEWTQVVRGSSNRFPNPLPEIQLISATLRSLIPNVPVSGIILFAGDCTFPKDKPKGVCLLSELPVKRRRQQVPPRFETAWELLLIKARQLSAN